MISICIQYYNRKQLLINTLESIRNSKVTDIEICIVDDASKESERIENLIDIFSDLNISIHRYDFEEKWWSCPVIPANKSVELSSGDKIILLGAECYMYNDIPKYVDDNLEKNKYLVFGTYALNKNETISNHQIQQYGFNGKEGWYQHSQFRPVGYNFCTAIMYEDFNSIGDLT